MILMQTVRGSVDRSFGYVFDYIRHVDNQVSYLWLLVT